MEVKQKIETRMLQSADGSRLHLNYYLLAQLHEPSRRLSGPYGIEIVLRTPEGEWRDVCRNMSESRKNALALLHLFAAHAVLPSCVRAVKDAG